MINAIIPSSKYGELAGRLVGHEAVGDHSPGAQTRAIFRVHEKLRHSLVTLMGTLGFRSLLARALLLATAGMADLKVVKVTPDGSLEGFNSIASQDMAVKAGLALLTKLLELLVTFIGEPLMLSLVIAEWSSFPVAGDTFGEKEL